MTPNMDKKIIAKNFSKSALSYDDHAAVQAKCSEKLIDLIDLEYFPSILEVGCGTGAYTQLLRKKYPDAEITAIDISENMIGLAKEKLKGQGINFLVSDGENFDPENKYKLITSNASFQWFEDLARTFETFKRKMSDDGILCFSIYGPDTFNEFKEVLGVHFGPRPWLSSSKFADRGNIEYALKKHFKDFDISEENFTVDFFSIWDFLKNIKRSGTQGEGLGRNIFLGKYTIKEMEKTYVEKFGKVAATHHVYFCKAQN